MASILAWQPPPPCERSGNLLEAIRVLKRTFVPHPSCANLAGFCCPHFFVLYSPKSGLYSRSLWMFHLNNTRPDRCSFETSFVDGMLLRAEGTSVQSRDCCNTLRSVKNLRPPEAARSRIDTCPLFREIGRPSKHDSTSKTVRLLVAAPIPDICHCRSDACTLARA